ncbi:MAG: FIST N-terminal domain-containing protein, partial [Desulfobacterales bacterium]
MIKAILGQSENIDTQTAVESVITQCQQKLSGHQPQAGIVFAGVAFDHRLMLDKILDKFPGLDLIGCTTAGEFSSSYGCSDDSISLMVFYSDDIEIGIGIGRTLSDNPDTAVQSAVKQASHKLSKRASICLAFPDVLNKSFDPILKKLNLVLGNDCPVFGGAAGTLWNEKLMPLQFFKDEILVDAIPLMIFAGSLEYAFSIANSWKPVGKQAKISRAEGRLVRRIDDFKAVDFYRYYLGDHSEPAREFLMAVYDKDSEHSYLRAPFEYNPDGSITFTDSIPQGATVQLTEAVSEIIIEDTKSTSQKMIQQVPDLVPEFAMAFSCSFRKDILGTRVKQELQILRDNLPKRLPIIGFYSFGEIAPLVKGQGSFFHGATLITLLVGQRNGGAGTKDEIEEGQFSDDSPTPISLKDSDDPQYMEQLKLEIRFLERKLNRSESYRERLEEIKDFNSTLHRKIIQEVEEARQEIQHKEMLLRKSEEKYRQIVTTAGEGFILMNEDLIITDVNEAFCRIIGYAKGELLGKTPFDFGVDEFRQFLPTNQEMTISEEYRKFEGFLKAKDGTLIPILTHGSKLRDDSGLIIGNMAFVTD